MKGSKMTYNVVKISTDQKRNKPNISDISSWKNENFYKQGRFMTISDFIATYENHEQTVFNVIAYHNIDATPLEIEKSILENALYTIGDDEEDELGSIHDLVKLSSCTHWMEKYEDKERQKITSFCERQMGQWYFQPDQRCAVVQEFIDDDPRIARDVRPFSEWAA
jgi:hypothetical protein